MNRFALPILAALILAPVAASHAETITFDGLTVNGTTNPEYVPVPTLDGLTFSNFYLLNTSDPNPAFQPAFPVSAPEVAYNSYGATASFGAAGGFTLNSLYLAGGDASDSVTLTATLLGGGTDSETFDVSISAPSLEVLNWTGVTSVTFTSPNNEYFAIDNVTVNATPEPSSLVLLGTGALSLAGAARRRFRKN